MRIPDVALKCVAFIGDAAITTPGGVCGDLHATGFLVSLPSIQEGRRLFCCVTAKHVQQDLCGRDIFFTLRGKEGLTTATPWDSEWFFHPSDKTTDIAMTFLKLPSGSDCAAVRIEDFVTPESQEENRIGVGDEVFITGLFTAVENTTQMEPIVRHGNIAMTPKEQIQTELGFANVILIEARSIGGISGSPVFVRPTKGLSGLNGYQEQIVYGLGEQVKLLGLAHGHWDVKESEKNSPHINNDRKNGVNLGIAIVIPAYKIAEMLAQPAVAEWQKRFLASRAGKLSE